MKLTGDAFRTTLALKNKYVSEVNDKVLKPLDDFLKTDLKDFKESKKTFDKALEKYESTLAKYNGQSRQKEPSALREEAFQLYDTRKAYIQAAMSCSMLCIKFQDALDQLVLGVFLDLIATQHDYFSGNADHFGSMALQVLQLKTYMKGHKDASSTTLQELEQNKERYISDAVEYWKPSRSLKSYSNTITSPKSLIGSAIGSTIGHAALGPAFAAQMAGQVPMGTLMSRLPIPSQFTTTPGSQPPTSLPSSLQEGNTSVDALSINTTIAKSNNVSSISLTNPSSPSSLNTETTLADVTPTTKQGYLNIRIPQPKNRAPVWQRKYFFIQEGEFGFETVVSNPTVGSQVVQSERIAVLLCEVRYGSSSNSLMALSGGGNPSSGSQGLAMVQMERRFCFEVVCATQSYLLQAETEDDLMSWVKTFEAAKRDALMQQSVPRRQEPDDLYSPVPDSANPSFSFSGEDLLAAETARLKASEDAGDSKPTGPLGLGWAASVPGVSLLLGSYNNSSAISSANNHSNKAGSASIDAPGTVAVSSAGDDITTQDLAEKIKATEPPKSEPRTVPIIDTTPASLPRSAPVSHSRSRSLEDATAGGSGHSQQLSEIEKLMTSSIHLVPKATPVAASELPHYPMELVVRNRELHTHFHGTKVRSKEYVLHSWTSGYLDNSRPANPITVYGRIFLTQAGMYFYSRGLSVETKRMYRFSTIRGIECEQKDISTEWRIETMDGVRHIFSQFTLSDTEYQVLHLIWTNMHSKNKDRLPVKELFRRTMLITNKPKGSAGSGSLAETESSHLTSREGTMTHPEGLGSDLVNEDADGFRSETTSVVGDDEDWRDLDEEIPDNIEVPAAPVSCNCPGHLEKLELERTFDISAKAMNRLLFGDNSPSATVIHILLVQDVGEWEQIADHRTRVVKFLMVVSNPLVKLNETDCVETQSCEVEEEYIRYSYTTKPRVLAMPYSDAFTPLVRYCITNVSKNQCKLTISSGIEWHKNPMVKAMIRGAVFKGTTETAKDVTEVIQLLLERRKAQNGHANAAAPVSTPAASKSGNGVDNSSNTNGDRLGSHRRSDSAKIMISLHGPDDDAHRILLDPNNLHDHGDSDISDSARENRSLGVRRHTVSAAAGAGGVMYSGARVHGHWPTGSQPKFVPIGSKESRTKLLGRPSREALVEKEEALPVTPVQKGASWLKSSVIDLIHSNDEVKRRSLSRKLLYVVLLVSSLINIWAAYNSQRMLNSAWKLKEHGSSASRDSSRPLKGYPEPFHRLFEQRSSTNGAGSHDYDSRNVRVAARAVYLKDLEERMQSGELDGFIDGDGNQSVDQKCFKVFLDVRRSFRPWPLQPPEWFPEQHNDSVHQETTLTLLEPAQHQEATSTSVEPAKSTLQASGSKATLYPEYEPTTRYPWLMPHHQRWATKIVFQRDRVGILRHDLLVTFEVLKQLERRLLETEYINWIMDERSRCRLWERRKNTAMELKRMKEQQRKTVLPEETASFDQEMAKFAQQEDSEEPVLKGEFLQLLETEQSLDQEQAKERIVRFLNREDEEKGRVETEREDESDDDPKAKVTEEFCAALDHQIELFMLDSRD
ncbi:SNF1-interacting protein [Dissophora globulifera]|uniref:SNF1-interacting protein n=1 Tax=Dissophora globulifera TaxID=979702 RepID=A0A9P6UP11_9FUNG|nr:SNF1-interacting protein [Dissophora globulifera]